MIIRTVVWTRIIEFLWRLFQCLQCHSNSKAIWKTRWEWRSPAWRMRNDFSMIDMKFVENTPSPLQKKEITRLYSAWNLNMLWQKNYHLDFSESACKQKTFGGVGLSQNKITISNLVISKKHNHLWMAFCAILFCFVFYNRILP